MMSKLDIKSEMRAIDTKDRKWYAPKLKFGHLLNVPLHDGENPPCVLFVKEANKLPEVLDISELW